MFLPRQSIGSVRYGQPNWPFYVGETEPLACNPNENCTVQGPNYPCPTIRNPRRTCASYVDNPVCQTRVTACKAHLLECGAAVIGSVIYTPTHMHASVMALWAAPYHAVPLQKACA